MLVKRAY